MRLWGGQRTQELGCIWAPRNGRHQGLEYSESPSSPCSPSFLLFLSAGFLLTLQNCFFSLLLAVQCNLLLKKAVGVSWLQFQVLWRRGLVA